MITLNIHFFLESKILEMESAHVLFKINKLANCHDVPAEWSKVSLF